MLAIAALATAIALSSAPAEAGCGCNKPPPVAAEVRPAFASPGDTVTLFPPGNRSGEYDVKFRRGGQTYEYKDVRAVYKRDLADGRYKWQVVVRAPQLSPGPTSIEMSKGRNDLDVSSADFTMMQPALVLQEKDSETTALCYSAAVTADGTVLIPLDISAIAQRMVFDGFGEGFPLLFGASDVMIYNTQGFLMQLLTPANASIYAITDPGNPDSFELTYDRHEFLTYRQTHAHENGFGLDPYDRNWHTDGSYHVDHDHLVVAIKGVLEGAGRPSPGKTSSFDLVVTTALAEAGGGTPTLRTIKWGRACGGPY